MLSFSFPILARTKMDSSRIKLLDICRKCSLALMVISCLSTASMSENHVFTTSTTRHTFKSPYRHRIFFQRGQSESDLQDCVESAVCNRVDAYATPWIERQCRCPNQGHCADTLNANDGHTIVDKSRQFKLCEPVKRLPICKYFKDITWTLTIWPGNVTIQKVNCVCPKHSVAYLFKHQEDNTDDGVINNYHFTCDPQFRLRCQRKEPCRLFSVKKRVDVEEVNTNTLCQCPHGFHCPTHHTDKHVLFGTFYKQDLIKTYSGYCNKG